MKEVKRYENLQFDIPDLSRFELGKIVQFPGIDGRLAEEGTTPERFLRRHGNGDWGEVSEEMKRLNERSMRAGGAISSRYSLSQRGWVLLITTEADRETTYIYMTEEDGC